MKSKWLLALTWLVIGMAALTGRIAYAEMNPVSMYEEPTYCADWSFGDRSCSAYLTESSGKAAFGEPTGQPMLPESTFNACEDWSFNTPGCSANLSTAEGKAAFGEAIMPRTEAVEAAAYCSDWNFNDENCTGYIRSN